MYVLRAYNIHMYLLRESIKQYAGSQYAPLLTRISFEVRSSHLEGQILTKNHQYEQIHVENFQGRNFLRKKSPCGMLHSKAKGFYHLFRSSQYAGLLQIPFNLKRYAARSQEPNHKHITFDCLPEYRELMKFSSHKMTMVSKCEAVQACSEYAY